MGDSGFSQKLVQRFGSISQRRKISSFYICVPSYRSRPFFVPEIEGQTGVKMGQKWVFRSFLKNWQTDLVPSLREGRHYHSTYLCQVSSPGHFSFSRYRVKWGSKRVKNGVFVVFSKTSQPIWFHLLEKEDIIILHMCAKLQVQAIFRSRDMGSNGGQTGVKIEFFDYISKSLHLFFKIFYIVIEVDKALLLLKSACLGKIWFSRYRAKRGLPPPPETQNFFRKKNFTIFFIFFFDNFF